MFSNITHGGRIYWRRPNAQSVALRGGLRFLRMAEFVTYNRAAIGGPSKRQPMKSLVSSYLGSTQTPKFIAVMYKKKIEENKYAASSTLYLYDITKGRI